MKESFLNYEACGPYYEIFMIAFFANPGVFRGLDGAYLSYS